MYQTRDRQRNRLSRTVCYGGVVLLLGGGLTFVYVLGWFEPTPSERSLRYLDTTLTQRERIDDLLGQMTLREKIGQMALVEKNSLSNNTDIATYHLGGLLSGAGAKPEQNTKEGWSEMIEGYQRAAQSTRLQIPLLYGVDAVHGHALVPGAVVFPHQIGLGATGDATLVTSIGKATAQDLVSTGVNWNYAPNLDLPQDIRWGRMYEAFSDDPILAARLGAAYVTGLQTPVSASSTIPVAATLKHYIGLGSMGWQTATNKNFVIDQGVTPADEVALRAHYLPPFRAGVEAGALAVMVGLNEWGDTKLIRNKYLITDVLKDEVGFPGFVVSDWYGVYEGTQNSFFALTKAMNAGVDMVMLPFDYQKFEHDMVLAVRLGFISHERIDDAVGRILRAKFALGLFDSTSTPVATTTPFSAHRALARAAVAQSLVLLKNDGAVLPLKPSLRQLFVTGSAADNVGMQLGAWSVEWQGIDGNWLPKSTSLLAALKARAPQNTQVLYRADGVFDRSCAEGIGIAFVGETPYAEGWGDRALPILGDADLEAIKHLQQHCSTVVVVIVSGRPLFIAGEISGWDAVVAAWLPGSEGSGVSDVLFGDQPFRGTLPLPWPKTSQQLPLTAAGVAADGTPVLFPRYFGLSY